MLFAAGRPQEAPGRPQEAPGGPRRPQAAPREAPGGHSRPQGAPGSSGRPQGSPKEAPGKPQERPRDPRETPGGPREAPRRENTKFREFTDSLHVITGARRPPEKPSQGRELVQRPPGRVKIAPLSSENRFWTQICTTLKRKPILDPNLHHEPRQELGPWVAAYKGT